MDVQSPKERQANQAFKDISLEKTFAIVAFGLLLAWMWMGLTEGYPIFMDGAIDPYSVGIMLLSFAASLLACGFVRALDSLLARPAFWIGSAVVTGAVCALLVCVFYGIVPVDEALRTPLVRCAMVVIGLGSGVLVQCCATAFACLRPVSMAVGFFLACVVMFIAYFSLAMGKTVNAHWAAFGFCLLPCIAAALLRGSRATITERLALWPAEPCGYARGYVLMCISFGVFAFAMAAKAAMEPPGEFAVASDTSVVGILLISLLFLYLVAIKPKPFGTFKLLKIVYSLSVVMLTICIALQRLSLDPVMSIVFNADCILLIMVLFLLTTFVAHANEAYTCKVVGIAFASAAVGMALGWVVCKLIYAQFGHDRVYFSIAIACATAVFTSISFSSKNFPYLTTNGEAAKKMQRTKQAAALLDVDFNALLATKVGLSSREQEVLELLAAGYNAVSIAEKLQVSYNTGRTHVRNVYKKLGVHSHAELLDACEKFRAEASAAAYGKNAKD